MHHTPDPRRLLPWMILLVAGTLVLAVPAAEAGRTVVRHGPRGTTVVHHRGPRTRVVVHRGWPLRRTLPAVAIHPYRRPLLVATPRHYLAAVVYRPVVVVAPAKEVLVWQDTDKFEKDADWTESTYSIGERGDRLVYHVDGTMQVSFAEVVFENGDSQVVDFNDKVLGEGTYQLLNFKDGRKVSHVRMVGRAKTEAASVSMFLAK